MQEDLSAVFHKYYHVLYEGCQCLRRFLLLCRCLGGQTPEQAAEVVAREFPLERLGRGLIALLKAQQLALDSPDAGKSIGLKDFALYD